MRQGAARTPGTRGRRCGEGNEASKDQLDDGQGRGWWVHPGNGANVEGEEGGRGGCYGGGRRRSLPGVGGYDLEREGDEGVVTHEEWIRKGREGLSPWWRGRGSLPGGGRGSHPAEGVDVWGGESPTCV